MRCDGRPMPTGTHVCGTQATLTGLPEGSHGNDAGQRPMPDPCHSGSNMLRLKKLGIDTCHETVAFLARRCPLYRAEEFVALARIEITGGGRRIVATLKIGRASCRGR